MVFDQHVVEKVEGEKGRTAARVGADVPYPDLVEQDLGGYSIG